MALLTPKLLSEEESCHITQRSVASGGIVNEHKGGDLSPNDKIPLFLSEIMKQPELDGILLSQSVFQSRTKSPSTILAN